MNLQEKQEKGLQILLAIDAVCKKHNIRYRLDSGTLLGAVRHKGFIPWDDDVDLCFLRAEWEKFAKVAEERQGVVVFLVSQLRVPWCVAD